MGKFIPISIDDLYGIQKNLSSDSVIVDVRSDEEYKEGHVPGAKNCSHDNITSIVSDLKKYKKVYLYCAAGGRVQMAAQDLLHAGLNEVTGVVGGGMPNWIINGFPVER